MKTVKNNENEIKVFEKVIPYLKQSIMAIILGIVVLIIVDAVQMVIPMVMRTAIDKIGTEGFSQSHLAFYSLLILFMAGVNAIMRYFWRMLIIGNSWKIERGLRQDFYQHLIRLSQNFFNRSKIGDLMAHSTNDMNAIRMLFGIGLIAAADIIIMMIATVSFMLTINVRLTLYAIIPLPLLSLAISFFGKRMHKQFTKVQKTFSDLSGMVQESISGVRVVKVFGQEKSELKKMNEFSDEYMVDNIKMAKLSGLFHPFLGFIISVSMMVVLILGGNATINKEITIGEFVAFNAYLGMLVWPMIAIGWIVELYQRGTASLKRLNKIFATQPEIIDEENVTAIEVLDGDIEVKNLTFSYSRDDNVIFQDISFKLKSGNTLAIVGRTGCGKTTLIDLLTRIYNPPRDSIFINGHEIYEIPLETLRNSLVLVPQDIFLFSDTIANNIKFGTPDATMDEIEKVACLAQICDEIKEFEQGFDTIIGERGVTLSGGQKQRIAIARALLTNPKTLILDDSLSAVDTKTEKEILNHLIEARRDRTTIIIAHRISSLQHAEKIIVLDQGKIIERGTHLELLQKGGIYWDLFEKQKLKERIEER